MPRYIDADALRQRMYHEAFETDTDMQKRDSGCWIRYKLFENCIDQMPTLSPDEVRGVVLCQDCDCWNEWDHAGRKSLGSYVCSCAHWTVEDGAVLYTKPTDFCSYGERKVSEDA